MKTRHDHNEWSGDTLPNKRRGKVEILKIKILDKISSKCSLISLNKETKNIQNGIKYANLTTKWFSPKKEINVVEKIWFKAFW